MNSLPLTYKRGPYNRDRSISAIHCVALSNITTRIAQILFNSFDSMQFGIDDNRSLLNKYYSFKLKFSTWNTNLTTTKKQFIRFMKYLIVDYFLFITPFISINSLKIEKFIEKHSFFHESYKIQGSLKGHLKFERLFTIYKFLTVSGPDEKPQALYLVYLLRFL